MSLFFLSVKMNPTRRYIWLGTILFLLLIPGIVGAVSITQKAPAYVDVSTTTVIPFAVSLNTVAGKGYYATLSVSAQAGLTASINTTAYPSIGTSTTNVTIPVGVSVSSTTPGVYQLNVTVTEYNSSTLPQSILATQKYSTLVYIISPTTYPLMSLSSSTSSTSETLTLTAPAGVSWYITYKALYPNVTVASSLYGFQAIATPQINVSITPSTTTGVGNATISFTVSETNNLKFGEIPVTVLVYQYVSGTNALYSIHVLHFRFFNIPANVIAVLSQSFTNFTNMGHVRFGNVSIQYANIPAKILGISSSSHSISILFNDSFTGIVSFYSNQTPVQVLADGHQLQEYFVTPNSLPLGGWTYYGGKVFVYADPSNVTAVYPTNTTTTTTSTTTSTTTLTTTVETYYQQHKGTVLITLVFLFIIMLLLFYRK